VSQIYIKIIALIIHKEYKGNNLKGIHCAGCNVSLRITCCL